VNDSASSNSDSAGHPKKGLPFSPADKARLAETPRGAVRVPSSLSGLQINGEPS